MGLTFQQVSRQRAFPAPLMAARQGLQIRSYSEKGMRYIRLSLLAQNAVSVCLTQHQTGPPPPEGKRETIQRELKVRAREDMPYLVSGCRGACRDRGHSGP